MLLPTKCASNLFVFCESLLLCLQMKKVKFFPDFARKVVFSVAFTQEDVRSTTKPVGFVSQVSDLVYSW